MMPRIGPTMTRRTSAIASRMRGASMDWASGRGLNHTNLPDTTGLALAKTGQMGPGWVGKQAAEK